MNESTVMIDLILLTLLLVLNIATLIPLVKLYTENKNRLNLGLIIYFISIFGSHFITFLLYLEIVGTVTIGYSLSIQFIFALISLAIQLEFIFYLKEWDMHYSLPFVITFFIMASLILFDSSITFFIYAAIMGFGVSSIIIVLGVKNRNAMAFGLGCFLFIVGVGEIIQAFQIQLIILSIGMLFAFLTTSGFFEKYFFFNKEEEEKVRSVWISKMVK